MKVHLIKYLQQQGARLIYASFFMLGLVIFELTGYFIRS